VRKYLIDTLIDIYNICNVKFSSERHCNLVCNKLYLSICSGAKALWAVKNNKCKDLNSLILGRLR